MLSMGHKWLISLGTAPIVLFGLAWLLCILQESLLINECVQILSTHAKATVDEVQLANTENCIGICCC